MSQKIVYTDEEGEIEVIQNAHKTKETKVQRSVREALIPILAVSILMGAVGGVAGTVIASNSPAVRHALGVIGGGSVINTIKTEKLIVQESSAIIDAAKDVSPAVVSISSKKNVTGYLGQDVIQEADGTGFIITNDGLIVTNKHVAPDANATYTVVMANGKTYKGKVVATDPYQDLTILKIDATGLPIVNLGNSDQMKVGQYVVAIGNALGQFQNSVTVGVISAKGRHIDAANSSNGQTESLEDLLQTDAAINEGNSGGPLVNLKGQVIGLNTAVASKSNAEGIGFAIPINDVINSINQVKDTGKIVRPYLGVSYVPITKDIAKANDLPVDHGAYLTSATGSNAIMPASPADQAGLKEGDIITQVDDTLIDDDNSLTRALSYYKAGDKVELTVIKGKDTKVIAATLGEFR